MDKKLQKWRDDGKHLPEFLRDFHDQKDLFKYLHDAVDIEGHDMVKNIQCMQGHAYTIDIFLFVMAKYGYTLQKSKAKQNFSDLNTVVKENNSRRSAMFTDALLSKVQKDTTE